MISKSMGKHHCRGMLSIALFAATALLAGGGQALIPATASAYQAEDVECDTWVQCSGDEGDGGDWGDGPGGSDDDPCAVISDCLGGMGGQGSSDPYETGDPCTDYGDCWGQWKGKDPYEESGDPCADYGECWDRWNGGSGGTPKLPCSDLFAKYMLTPEGPESPEAEEALKAFLVCVQDLPKVIIVGRTDPAGPQANEGTGVAQAAESAKRSRKHRARHHASRTRSLR